MNESYDKVISEYRGADFNRRLHMYLQFPRLRSEFFTIDQKDLNTDQYAGFKLRANSLAAKMSAILSLVRVSAKRLCGIASA
jgi:hypothetical protein